MLHKKYSRMRYIGLILLLVISTKAISQNTYHSDSFLPKKELESTSFDKNKWNITDSNIITGEYGLVNSVLIIHNDTLILEEYYNGQVPNDIHDLKSTTKSIASILIGKAVEIGAIESVDDKMVNFFPEIGYDTQDSFRSEISLQV